MGLDSLVHELKINNNPKSKIIDIFKKILSLRGVPSTRSGQAFAEAISSLLNQEIASLRSARKDSNILIDYQ